MKKFLKDYGYALILAFVLTIFGRIDVTQWQYYAIIIPVIIGVSWKD